MNDVYMGTIPEIWANHLRIKYITFCVTESCNLACTYCYFTHKNDKTKMSLDIAKECVDYILNDAGMLDYDGVVWDFIGGEPTLELDLISALCDYIVSRMFIMNHKWFYCYRFMIGTNGLLYNSNKMQELLRRHDKNISVAMTIDGSKTKHDLSRKKRDGTGSYDDVLANAKLWMKQQGSFTTKSTFAHDDLPFLKESIISLWNIGISNVMANVVFENVWSDGDAEIFKEQLMALADYVIENKLWDKYSVRFFSTGLGMPIADCELCQNTCGTGSMLAIDTQGNFYPCIRFMPSALSKKSGLVIGNYKDGIDADKVRPFYALDYRAQSPSQCMECEVSSQCSWCTGLNYDEAEIPTVFDRQIFNCDMHKATVTACEYFWKRYEEVTGKMSPRRLEEYTKLSSQHKFLYIITNKSAASYCHYETAPDSDEKMSLSMLEQAYDFCNKNRYTPVFVGDKPNDMFGYQISNFDPQRAADQFYASVIDISSLPKITEVAAGSKLIVKVDAESLSSIYRLLRPLLSINEININLKITDLSALTVNDLKKYREQMLNVAREVFNQWRNNNRINVSTITHALYMNKKEPCGAGDTSFALGPNGKFYICPAFYYHDDGAFSIGNIEDGIDFKYRKFCTNKRATFCKECDCYSCTSCVFWSKMLTNELGVPSEIQCVLANIDKEISKFFLEALRQQNIEVPEVVANMILQQQNESYDPLSKINRFCLTKGYREFLQ